MAQHSSALESPSSLPSFDELKQLAQTDPDALTQLRQQLAQEAIERVPAERRQQLQALQSHIERKLSVAKNPLHAAVLLSEEMQRTLNKLQRALANPGGYLAELQQKSADVLRFPTNTQGPSDD